LKGKKELRSFDLQAATDSLPVDLSGSMLAVWRSVGSVVVLLNEKTFLSFSRTLRVTNQSVSPSGQPDGYDSSWPVFALTHHM
jgi:hypothetical protein